MIKVINKGGFDMKYNYPKIDLHLHLDGSILPQTAWELVQKQGVEVPAKDLESFIPLIMVPQNCKDVNECLERFEIPVQILQDKASLKRVTQEWGFSRPRSCLAETPRNRYWDHFVRHEHRGGNDKYGGKLRNRAPDKGIFGERCCCP